jgi:putative peptidoglycan binding protein
MQVFNNKTTAGHELAIRKGKRVPEDSVGLSYVKTPHLNPRDNVVIVDTSRIVEGNAIAATDQRRLYYANGIGILEDLNGNQLVEDEFPYITDIFTLGDEDAYTIPGSAYKPEFILPFVHVSRYFHLHFAGLAMPGDLLDWNEDVLKVVDARGRQYLDADGRPRYKVKLSPAYTTGANLTDYEGAYRVYAYIDSDQNDELYLTYNKVEVSAQGALINRQLNYKELLNLRPVFEYLPEESEVVDRGSYYRRVYSTKPVTMKEQILKMPYPNVDGYKIYVPKKAIGDPRIFQLFHWRLTCDFTQSFTTDAFRVTDQKVRAGILTTNGGALGNAPYCLLNLMRSAYNATELSIENPLGTGDNTRAAYWQVNIDTVTEDQLKQFDLLVWAPSSPEFNFNFQGYAQKIDTFTRSLGGTLIIDTSSYTVPQGLQITTTNGPTVTNGAARTTAGVAGTAQVNGPAVAPTDPLFAGVSALGGWDIPDSEFESSNDERLSLSWIQQLYPDVGYTQHITAYPSDWTVLVSVNGKPVTIKKSTGKGNIIFSTFGHLFTCSALFNDIAPEKLYDNLGSSAQATTRYEPYINSIHVEGAMKFLFNVVLLSVKGKSLDDSDQRAYSTSWTLSTPWKSSWVIDASVLTDDESAKYNFTRATPKDPHADPPDNTEVRKRRLSERTCAELINEALNADPMLRNRQLGGVRQFKLEISNTSVLVQTALYDEDKPEIWTEAYSPLFEVPPSLGPNLIKEEEIKGEYAAATYEHRTYPPKPYAGQASTYYTDTFEVLEEKTLRWVARGTAIETRPGHRLVSAGGIETIPGNDVRVPLSWRNRAQQWSPGAGVVAVDSNTPGLPSWYKQVGAEFKPRLGFFHPIGIATWQEHNYYGGLSGNAHLNWPFMGMTGRFLEGARGEVVTFIQDFLNRAIGAGLSLDGSYGSKVAGAVASFQTSRGARFVDGVIDAETWSLIGYAIVANGYRGVGASDWHRFYEYPWNFLQMQHISDENTGSVYAKRSWAVNGVTIKAPPAIWDYILITFDKPYDIVAVSIIPYVEGQEPTIVLRSVEIAGFLPGLVGYTPANAQIRDQMIRMNRDTPYEAGVNGRGQCIVVGLGQDRPAGPGWGEARMFGVRDILAWTWEHTTTTRTRPDVYDDSDQQFPIDLVVTGTGTFTVSALHDARFTVDAKQSTGLQTGRLSNIKWSGNSQGRALDILDLNGNPATDVKASIDESSGFVVVQSHLVDQLAVTNINKGPEIPGSPRPTYYSMNAATRIVSRIPEQGFVSRAEGVKVLVTDPDNPKPYGLPTPPSLAGGNEAQRHYMKMILQGLGNDNSVTMGFYDIKEKEFIVNADKKSEMSYLDWVSRGIENVYIAVVSEYEDAAIEQIPTSADAPKLPYRWAMPLYGVLRRTGARVTLEPLPANLGVSDVWPVAVRDGRFSVLVSVRARSEGFLTTYLKDYQSTQVRAFYGVPDNGGWSTLYGPPFADVVGEEPIIVDDDIIQVRQTPIHIVAEPTRYRTYADPVRPVFTVYQRASVGAPWVAMSWPTIRDYNRRTGEIFLTSALQSDDSSLLKVDYTTERRHFYFKKFGSTVLNLNPYSGSREYIGKPIYIYLVPQFVRDQYGSVILASVATDTVRFTTTPEIFDSIRPEYDPLAVMLGVLYMSTASDIASLAMMDIRRRGGGIKESATAQEVARLVQESATYWDISLGTGNSYQKAGFLVIRLPSQLKDYCTEQQIVEAVERNITTGVRYKIEDLVGNDWSSS